MTREDLQCTLLNNDSIKPEFHFCSFHDPLLHRALRNKSEHMDLFFLSNTMGAVLRSKTESLVELITQ